MQTIHRYRLEIRLGDEDSRVNAIVDICAIRIVHIPDVIKFLPWMLRFTIEKLVHKALLISQSITYVN